MSKRLLKEFKACLKENDDQFEFFVKRENLRQWNCLIYGPADTPYKDGFFELSITLSPSYPIKPPKVKFLTRIFHPNINIKTGEICLDVLKTNWTPAWTLLNVVRAIIALLYAPESSSPLNCDAGNLLRLNDKIGYESLAVMYTKMYAKKNCLSKEYKFKKK